MDTPNIHYTLTHRIRALNGSGWEFSCRACNYKARYTQIPGRDDLKFEIIDIGDSTARHTNNSPDEFLTQALPGSNEDLSLNQAEASWLTSDLRDRIDQILGRFDWK